MQHKNLFIPVLVFIFSFGILSVYQKSHPSVTLASTVDTPPILWSKSPADITSVTYAMGDKKITVQRKEDDWLLTSLGNQKADSLYVYQAINYFLEPHFKEVITTSARDLTTYGIDENAPTLTLSDTEGASYCLIKGNCIDEELVYVYAPLSHTIYSMENALFDSLSLNIEDWRNKELLSFDLNNVAKISFSYKNLECTLLPEKDETGLTFKAEGINPSLVEKFISFLQTSKVQQFITDNASEHVLQIYGFTSPRLTCDITLVSGTPLSLTIGLIKEDENICYAKVNDSSSIVAIPYFDFSQFDTLFAELEAIDALTIG